MIFYYQFLSPAISMNMKLFSVGVTNLRQNATLYFTAISPSEAGTDRTLWSPSSSSFTFDIHISCSCDSKCCPGGIPLPDLSVCSPLIKHSFKLQQEFQPGASYSRKRLYLGYLSSASPRKWGARSIISSRMLWQHKRFREYPALM